MGVMAGIKFCATMIFTAMMIAIFIDGVGMDNVVYGIYSFQPVNSGWNIDNAFQGLFNTSHLIPKICVFVGFIGLFFSIFSVESQDQNRRV